MESIDSRAAVFLDRDGVLNESHDVDGVPTPPATVAELRLLPGAAAACARLRSAGLLVICVSNQPDIARGSTTLQAVDAINGELRRHVALDEVFICPHDDVDGCDCRKPQPGLLLRGQREFGVDLAGSVMVGDRWRDIEAGRRAGCSTVLIGHDRREDTGTAADLVVASLAEAVPWILDRTAQAVIGSQTP